VAVAGLIRAIQEGRVDADAVILLNITGGGYERIPAEVGVVTKPVDLALQGKDPMEQVCREIEKRLHAHA